MPPQPHPRSLKRRLFGATGLRSGHSRRRTDALEALHLHAGLVISAAGRITGNITDAEDIAQDIAEKLLRSPPDDVKSWPALLKTMAVNAAVDQLRRRRDGSDLPEPDAVHGPETLVSDAQRAEVLRAAIAELPERDGQLFSLYYFGDLSQVQIAEQLDMTPNSVGVAIHRLRQRLTRSVRDRLGISETGDITS